MAANAAERMAAVLLKQRDFIKHGSLLQDGCEDKFLEFVTNVKNLEGWIRESMTHRSEVSRLQTELIKSQAEVTKLKKQIEGAQHLLGMEKEKRIMAETQVKSIVQMVERLKSEPLKREEEKVLSALSSSLELGRLSVEGKGLNRNNLMSPKAPLSTIDESANTLDEVSDIDLTEGDELDISSVLAAYDSPTKRKSSRGVGRKSGGKRRVSPVRNEEEEVKRYKQQRCEAFSTPYTPSAPPLPMDEDIYTPHTKRQAPPPPKRTHQYSTPTGLSPHMRAQLSASRVLSRPHCFCTKVFYVREYCQPCGKKLSFSKEALRCRDCRAVCHKDCRDSVPLPCVPAVSTPGSKSNLKSIADFTPKVAPMVPALIIHCTNEVERRGFNELGIYRVGSIERDMKELKEKFMQGKGLPNLHNTDIFVVCNTVKHFLRGLKEPLIIHSLWSDFVRAANKVEQSDVEASLYQAVSELPQPNRDSLAWMITHLQRVGEMKECMMPLDNLAKVFGPTLVGYSVTDPEPEQILRETPEQQRVMSALLAISSDYWEKFTQTDDCQLFGPGDSMNFLTPSSRPSRSLANKSNRRRSIIGKTPLKV